MLAAVFVKPGSPLELQQLPEPEPGRGEVLLRVDRCGICTSDLLVTEAGRFTRPPGFIPGHERATEVVALGKGVERLKVGDHVVPHPSRGCGRCAECLGGSPRFCEQSQSNMGGFAQYVACPEVVCARVPIALSATDAALVEPLAVGLLAMDLVPVPVGAKVAVLGAGPVGIAATFWARRSGAGKIAVIARSRVSQAIAEGVGADAFITTSENLTREVQDALGGQPDVVIECAGKPGTIAQSIELVRLRGTIVVLGMCTHSDSWVPAMPLLKEVRIQFAVGTSLRQFVTAADTLMAGHIEPRLMVTDTISLAELPETFEALRSPSPHCKVLVDPWRNLA